MPAKRRLEKRRLDPAAEVEIWRNMFGHGCDWFDDVADHTGLTDPIRVWPREARDKAKEPWRAAAKEAWAQLGERYLPLHDSDKPVWAEEQFGRPWEVTHA